jgi:hypothetical protein
LIVPTDDTTDENPLRVVALEQQQQHGGGDIVSEMQALRLEVHAMGEALPSVLRGHVLTPSQASRIPQVVSSVLDSRGLTRSPESTGVTCKLPDNCGDEWKFDWKWPKNAGGDDRGLELQSYGPVHLLIKDYLGKLGFFRVDVSEGQFCGDKLLFNADVYTRRNQNPMVVRGQTVYLRHRIQGRTDLAVLRQDKKGGYILRERPDTHDLTKNALSLTCAVKYCSDSVKIMYLCTCGTLSNGPRTTVSTALLHNS